MRRPLVAMQSLDNTQDVAVCRNCLGFVGDVILQLELLSGIPRHKCLERHEIRHHGERPVTTEEAGSLSGLHLCLQGCGEVYCSAECRAEHFKRCHHLLCVGPVSEEEAETHPLVAFRVHAMQTNEIFLLVGEVIAQTVAAAIPSPSSAPDLINLASARAPFTDFVQEPWWDVAAPRAAGSSNHGGVDARAASLPETLRSLCEESSTLLRSSFGALPQAIERELTAERFGRVVGMFEQNNVGVRVSSPVPSLLGGVIAMREKLSGASLDELVGLVGQIEEFQEDDSGCDSGDEGGQEIEEGCAGNKEKRGCCGGEEDSGDEGRQENEKGCAGDEESSGCCVEEKGSVDRNVLPVCASKGCCADEVVSGSHEDDRIDMVQKAATTERPDDMFAPLDGTALYSLICCMNHSCRPNCVVRYPGVVSSPSSSTRNDRALPLVAQVVLIEEVAAGDELTQSYVDKEMGLVERRKALEDYGFLCMCPRCVQEEVSM